MGLGKFYADLFCAGTYYPINEQTGDVEAGNAAAYYKQGRVSQASMAMRAKMYTCPTSAMVRSLSGAVTGWIAFLRSIPISPR